MLILCIVAFSLLLGAGMSKGGTSLAAGLSWTFCVAVLAALEWKARAEGGHSILLSLVRSSLGMLAIALGLAQASKRVSNVGLSSWLRSSHAGLAVLFSLTTLSCLFGRVAFVSTAYATSLPRLHSKVGDTRRGVVEAIELSLSNNEVLSLGIWRGAYRSVRTELQFTRRAGEWVPFGNRYDITYIGDSKTRFSLFIQEERLRAIAVERYWGPEFLPKVFPYSM